jgi:hypothetical protein
LKAICHKCRVWDDVENRWVYHMATMTDWLPKPGHDPNIREFKCSNCGDVFYKLLTAEELKE